jgi:hypothetical protein
LKKAGLGRYFPEREKQGVDDLSSLDATLFAIFNGLPAPMYPPAGDPGAPDYNDTTQNNITQEIRIQSTRQSDRLNWLAGIFYGRNRQSTNQRVPDPLYNDFFASFFGVPNDGIYNFTDHLKTRDESAGSVDGGPHAFCGEQQETPVTPRYTVSWQLNPNNLLYAVAKGYRVGGANAPIPLTPLCVAGIATLGLSNVPQTYSSDTTTSYEIGSKNRLAGGRVAIDASVFHIDWNRIQQDVN